jgi:Fic family protein
MPPRFTITPLADRIRGEFVEAPGLAITIHQAVRFWVLDAQTCARVLAELCELGFLVETADGYCRRHAR